MAEEYELADALHEATTHRDLAERLARCEEELGILRGDLAAHVDEPVELIEVEVDESDGAQVDIEQAEASGDDADADAGEDERAG